MHQSRHSRKRTTRKAAERLLFSPTPGDGFAARSRRISPGHDFDLPLKCEWHGVSDEAVLRLATRLGWMRRCADLHAFTLRVYHEHVHVGCGATQHDVGVYCSARGVGR